MANETPDESPEVWREEIKREAEYWSADEAAKNLKQMLESPAGQEPIEANKERIYVSFIETMLSCSRTGHVTTDPKTGVMNLHPAKASLGPYLAVCISAGVMYAEVGPDDDDRVPVVAIASSCTDDNGEQYWDLHDGSEGGGALYSARFHTYHRPRPSQP